VVIPKVLPVAAEPPSIGTAITIDVDHLFAGGTGGHTATGCPSGGER